MNSKQTAKLKTLKVQLKEERAALRKVKSENKDVIKAGKIAQRMIDKAETRANKTAGKIAAMTEVNENA